MLMSRRRTTSTTLETANVHNYYERLVNETILETHSRALTDTDFVADVSCVALNHLPPRYIRYDVDMSFFMSPVEREETATKVQQAVDHAIDFVLEHEKQKSEENESLSAQSAEPDVREPQNITIDKPDQAH